MEMEDGAGVLTMNTVWTLSKRTFQEWRDDNVTRLAAALSYYTAISIAPLLVLALSIAGLFFDSQTALQQLSGQIQSIVGRQSAEVLTAVLENADQPSTAGFASIMGILVLLWGASNVFAQLQDALNTVWDVELKPEVGFWVTIRERFLSFGMVLVIGFLLLVSLALSALISLVSSQLGRFLPGIDWVWQLASFVISFLLVTVLFALIYKVLPEVKIAWRDVWWGAAVTAFLFAIGKYLLGLYLGMQSLSSSYGAAGSLVVFLIWVYFSAQIFFFGAEFTQVYARHRGRGIEPAEHTQFIEPSESRIESTE